MIKYLTFALIIVVCLFSIFFIIKMGTHNSVAPDASKSMTFSIGSYKLNASVKDYKELEEISPSEYNVIQKEFENEKIYKAPGINFLGVTWNMMLLGSVGDKIYKINPGYATLDKNQANEVFMKTLTYCKSKLGEPSEQQTGSFSWSTSDGDVVLQLATTPEEVLVLLFLTSKSVKDFKQLE
jgi:hypothetical protein